MTKRDKKLIIAMWLGIFSLVIAIKYSGILFNGVQMIGSILMPFIIGGVIAFIVNIPLNVIEKRLFKNSKLKNNRGLNILLSYCFILLIILIVVGTITPQLVITTTDLFQKVPKAIESVEQWISTFDFNNDYITGIINTLQFTELNWESLVSKFQEFLQSGLTNFAGQIIGATSSVIGGIVNLAIAFIFSLYILGSKEKLQRQVGLFIKAYFPEKFCVQVEKVAKLLYLNFSSFIKVQCLEACIFGMLFVVSMTILRLPYAIMIGVLMAFTALLPIIGGMIGCVIGTLMILIISPVQAVIFVILYFVIQQVEGNLIYPRVVGNAVGLPAMWTLAAVTIGGSLFGVVGMLAFIPLFSTVYVLLKENVHDRINKKAKIQVKEQDSDNN